MMVYTHTDIGRKRSENQDSTGVAVLDGAVFAVVCDGMGGSNAGSEASSRAVSVITERIQKATAAITMTTRYEISLLRL